MEIPQKFCSNIDFYNIIPKRIIAKNLGKNSPKYDIKSQEVEELLDKWGKVSFQLEVEFGGFIRHITLAFLEENSCNPELLPRLQEINVNELEVQIVGFSTFGRRNPFIVAIVHFGKHQEILQNINLLGDKEGTTEERNFHLSTCLGWQNGTICLRGDDEMTDEHKIVVKWIVEIGNFYENASDKFLLKKFRQMCV